MPMRIRTPTQTRTAMSTATLQMVGWAPPQVTAAADAGRLAGEQHGSFGSIWYELYFKLLNILD
jgi:hypothetical protein